MGIFSKREPRKREPAGIIEARVLHKTKENVEAYLGSVVWVQDVMADPERFKELPYRYRLIQANDQSDEEFEELADLVYGLADGSIKNAIHVVPRKRNYPPLASLGFSNFFIVEDLAHRVATSGKPDPTTLTFVRYPGQTKKGLAECKAFVMAAWAKWTEMNGPRVMPDPGPGAWFDPGPPQPVFTP